MLDISIPRIQRYALILGVAGTAAAFFTLGAPHAAGFAVGALIARLTIDSWTRLATSLNPELKTGRPTVGGSAAFLALRYALIAGAIYGIVKVLGVTPVAMLLGLLVSFAAVIIEIVQQVSKR
ncbi:MAG: hypothetical protein WDO18_19590 [Acidobacteriota bacterium]